MEALVYFTVTVLPLDQEQLIVILELQEIKKARVFILDICINQTFGI